MQIALNIERVSCVNVDSIYMIPSQYRASSVLVALQLTIVKESHPISCLIEIQIVCLFCTFALT